MDKQTEMNEQAIELLLTALQADFEMLQRRDKSTSPTKQKSPTKKRGLPKPTNWVTPKRTGGYEDLPSLRVSPQNKKRRISPTITNSKYQTQALNEANDILALYRRQEMEHPVVVKQGVPEAERTKTLVWMYEIMKKMNVVPVGMYLAFKIFDLFTSARPVGKYYLVGAASILIASKYEEMFPVLVEDLEYLAKNSGVDVKDSDIRRTEKIILKYLNWEVTFPAEYHFFHTYINAIDTPFTKAQLEKEERQILFKTVLDHKLITSTPSFKAAIALYLTLMKLTNNNITPELAEQIEFFTQYPISSIQSTL